jgi:multiple antibiotic resistance protein
MLITFILFFIVSKSQQFINKKVINVFSRVIAIILAGLSVQYIIDGVISLI